jgi:cytochrome c556
MRIHPTNKLAARLLAAAVIVATAACGETPSTADAPTTEPRALEPRGLEPPSQAPGWTGATAPEEVIEARRVLMQEAERQMKAIDQFSIGEPAEPAALKASAVTIEALLLALPHLFPPTTDRYDPTTLEPPTIALPAIWDRFDAFLEMGIEAEAAAAELILADTEPQLRAAARTLRAACDACHVAFTKPYVPPKVTAEDLEFDFEEFLPQ